MITRLRVERLILVAFLLLIVAIRYQSFLGRLWGNGGTVILNYGLATTDGYLGNAESVLQKALAYQSENRSAWRSLGLIWALQGREEKAQVAWRAAGDMAEELTRWGTKALWNEQYRTALRWYQRAVVVDPARGDPWANMGLTYIRLEEWEKAFAAYQTALDLPLITGATSDVHYWLGWLQFRKLSPPRLKTALSAFDAALAIDQFSQKTLVVQTHFQRAEVLRRLGRLPEALQEYKWVIAERPDHYAALVNLGVLYWEVEQNPSRAETILEKARSLEPDSKWAYRGLAQVYEETGRMDEAIKMYERILTLDPQDRLALERHDALTPSSGE